MRHFDVFNGDADGLCALQQLRLADPVQAVLVTGPKREVALLERVDAKPGDVVTVLDVALSANREALLSMLGSGVDVVYFDHHGREGAPSHPRLRAIIDTQPGVCTSLIVDRWLAGAHRHWALVGAYGDGLVAEADRIADELGCDAGERDALKELGIDLNYNAYGDGLSDLVVDPAHLHRLLRCQPDPLAVEDVDGALERIRRTRHADMARAIEQRVDPVGDHAAIVLLPDAAWSRRVRGTLAHELAHRAPERACAVLSPNVRGGYTVSVRAPLADRRGADVLCRRFETGEGRAAAAGINDLPSGSLQAFVAALREAFAGVSRPR